MINLNQHCQVLEGQESEIALKKMNDFLVTKFGDNMMPWTDYYVCNTYCDANQRAGSHTDADPLWGPKNGESVILSYTYDQACIFLTEPTSDRGHRANDCLWESLKAGGDISGQKNGAAQVLTAGLVEAIYCPPNSLLVMGGYYQGQMMHETLSHNLCIRIGEALQQGGVDAVMALSLDEADIPCRNKLVVAPGWMNTVATYCSHQDNKLFSGRTVFTVRHVVAHQNICPQSSHALEPLPAAPPSHVDDLLERARRDTQRQQMQLEQQQREQQQQQQLEQQQQQQQQQLQQQHLQQLGQQQHQHPQLQQHQQPQQPKAQPPWHRPQNNEQQQQQELELQRQQHDEQTHRQTKQQLEAICNQQLQQQQSEQVAQQQLQQQQQQQQQQHQQDLQRQQLEEQHRD